MSSRWKGTFRLDHELWSIDRFVELGDLRRQKLVPFTAAWADPRLILRFSSETPIIGYCFGIRSERRLCEEVHLNPAQQAVSPARP